MISDLLKLLTGGFTMGWGPCLAYTAPLLLPYIGGTKASWRAGLRVGLMFSLGRLISLVILGALATVAFKTINRFFPPTRSGYLHLVTALLMVTLGVLILLDKGFRIPIGGAWRKRMLDRGDESMLFLGFLVGLSPCAPLVAVLTYIACTAGNLASGALYALSFGIGTAFSAIAVSALTGLFPERIFRGRRPRRVFQIVCGAVLILFGAQLIYYVQDVMF